LERVIVLLLSAPVFGAVESYAAEIVKGLQVRGREATVLHPDADELAPLEALAAGTVRVEAYPPGLESGSALRGIRYLRRRLRELRPDVVHVTDSWTVGILAARMAGAPRVIVTHHTPELPRRDNALGRALWRVAWATRPEVIYTSESDRRTDGRSVDSRVIYYGIDLERFGSATPALNVGGRLVGNVARLAPQKGQSVLLDAAPLVLQRHPDVRFVFVGDGELRRELELHARRLGIADRVVFTGPRTDIPELLASFSVFALPSYFEGLCYAVIEAQAAGVPVVATPVGGVRETVVPGETGVRCEPGDPVSLADGIGALLDDPDEARRLAGEARRRVRDRFATERMVAETIAFYEESAGSAR
jgi:glycosyltransferase involved in cell wall biosynthesis